jgi:hypothetical protein
MNNKTGYNGICETVTGQGQGGIPIPCFEVHWMGTNRKFCFSTWGGREGAFRAAQDYRRSKEAEALLTGPVHRHCKKAQNGAVSAAA